MTEPKRQIELGKRLGAIAEIIRSGVPVIDIGTDHAYLPVYLVGSGKSPSAVAADIATGPLSKAVNTVRTAGLEDKIKTLISDGLDEIELLSPCDVVIAGMGGELIAKIIDRKKELRCEDIRLILQPMTKSDRLRAFLCKNGFEIEKEILVREEKLYSVILCSYTGKGYELDGAELLCGRAKDHGDRGLYEELIREQIARLDAVLKEKSSAGIDAEAERRTILLLENTFNGDRYESN